MGIKQPECEGKGCCWRPLKDGSKAPWCFFPAKKGDGQILLHAFTDIECEAAL